jgi:single-strand DNA-binding protein
LPLKNNYTIFTFEKYLITFKTIFMSVNKVILVGNVGKDPEVRHLENGSAVSTIALATSDYYTNKSGEKVTSTEWHNVVLWRSLAELAEKYIRKGSQIYVEGKIRSRSYDDKDGNKRYITEIVADTVQLLGRKQEEGQGASPQSSAEPSSKQEESFQVNDSQIDDLPF